MTWQRYWRRRFIRLVSYLVGTAALAAWHLPQSPQTATSLRTSKTNWLALSELDSLDLTSFRAWTSLSGDTLTGFEPSTGTAHVFRSRAAASRWFGRRGGGPGEFRSIIAAGRFDSGLWIVDPTLRRVSVFSREGRLRETIDFSRGLPPACSAMGVIGLTTNKQLVAAPLLQQRTSQAKRVATPILLLTPSAGACDTLVHVLAGQPFLMTSQGVVAYQPFDDGAKVLVDGLGRVLIIEPGSTLASMRAIRVRAFEPRTTRWTDQTHHLPSVPVSPRVRDSIGLEADRLLNVLRVTSSERKRVIAEQLKLPTEYPPTLEAIAGADGSSALERPPRVPALREYLILRANLSVLGTLALERQERVIALQLPWVWALRSDQGESELVRHQIQEFSK